MLQGIELMLVGMGTVFVFLSLLVMATRAMSAVALRIAGAQNPEHPNAEEMAAIAAALELHRRRR
jgi:oxaloacetate decarboxylase gamma subunit